MTIRITPSRNRRAAIAPLAALLMTFLVGMLAFSIDIGYICSVQAELQDAADAAALAGAQQLQNPFVAYFSPGITDSQQKQIYLTATTDTTNPASPIPTAQQYAAYNQAGGVYINVPVTDISFQYYDGTSFSSPSYTNNLFPNTVTVTTRRDTNANGSLGLFFAPIFGLSTSNLTATASATIYAGDVTSLQVIPGVNAHILPVALDVNVWTNFMKGNFTSPWLNGVVTTASNGNPQLQVYIQSTNTPGSFGLLDVGVPSNNTPAFRNWIDTGSTPNDISYLLNNGLLPVSPSDPQQWKCGPGLKSTLLSNFQSQIGNPNLIPLFAPVSPTGSTAPTAGNYVAASGTGQNATYAVVGFAGVQISQADGSGGGLTVSIQPSAIVDPTEVILDAKPAGSSLTVFGTSQTTFVSAKLTR
jgi:Flp pilus assembly protein TadG